MIWLSWRQQRTETLVTAALLALLAVGFVPAGMHLADLFTQEHIARCVDRHTQACSFAIGSFAASPGFLRSLFAAGWLNFIPGLIGVGLAVPLLLDLETGTVRLAWTQSVTKRRWLATKLGLAVGTVLLTSVGFSVLFTWYQQPLARVYGRWDNFDFEWIVPIGYALFALGTTFAIGVVLRRSAAAAVVAFGIYVAARLFVDSFLRQHFATPLSATWKNAAPGPNLSHAWVISQGLSDRAGHPFAGDSRILAQCANLNGNVKSLAQSCLARHGAGFSHAVYQPASRFWEFQGIETALFGGIALLLLAAAATWLVRRPS